MQTRIKVKCVLLLAMIAVSSAAAVSNAQIVDVSRKPTRAEFAVDFVYVHSNAPPGSCGCFNLTGGSGTFAWHLRPGPIALVGDVGVTHAGSISSDKYSLTLSTYTAGARFSPRLRHSPVKPFGQLLIGVAHASGSLVQGQNGSAATGGNAFGSLVGGGIDVRATRSLSLRLIEGDYLVTTFKNGVNDHQNMLRLSAGIVFHY